MIVLNSFVAKQGPAGKRNRAARRKQERIEHFHSVRGHLVHATRTNQILDKIQNHKKSFRLVTDDVVAEDFGLTGTKPGIIPASVFEQKEEPKVDFSGPWDNTVAQLALKAFAESGKSQRAFATEHGFPASRLSSWKKKLEVSQ